MSIADAVRRTLIVAAALLAAASVAHAGGRQCRTMQCESDPAAAVTPPTAPASPADVRATAASRDAGAPEHPSGGAAPAPPERHRHRATTPVRVLTARPTVRAKAPGKNLPATPSLSTLLRLSTGSGDEVSFVIEPAKDTRLQWIEGRGPPRAGPHPILPPSPARRARPSADLFAGPDPDALTPDLRFDRCRPGSSVSDACAGPRTPPTAPAAPGPRALRPEEAGARFLPSSGGFTS